MNPRVLFWRAFYKLKFGKNYQERMNNASRMVSTINQSSVGNLSSFYNTDGQQIRGWHRHIRFAPTVPVQHPLITKYSD
jgi:hypothetical protein